MLLSYGLLLLFNLISMTWLVSAPWSRGARRFRWPLLALGIVCLLSLLVQKVMVDEVAHQTVAGWAIQGEYILLYGMLTLQLVYSNVPR